MKLYEYQSKHIFEQCGIPIPKSKVAFTLAEVRNFSKAMGGPVLIKSQSLAQNSSDTNQTLLANDAEEAQAYAERLLSGKGNGTIIQKVLVEEVIEATKAFYLSVMIDRTTNVPLFVTSPRQLIEGDTMASSEIGSDVTRLQVDPLIGLQTFQARNLAYDIGLRRRSINDFVKIAEGLYRAFVENDAWLVEIDPLIVTSDGRLIAAGAKIELDDNALYRHPELADKRVFQEGDDAERQAYQAGLSYIKLDGNIGCLVNGAGLAMATLDIIEHYGGKPANFLDIGGGANAFKVAAALRIILADKDVKVIFFNIFGGITRCDEVAHGILDALKDVQIKIPLVIRLVGTNGEQGREILAKANIRCLKSLSQAVQHTIAEVEGGPQLKWAS